MSHCTDCNDSILNGQVSLIPDPVCHNNCGTETPCEGIGTYTNCVTMNNALTCIGSISGVTLSSVLTMLDTKLCQVIAGKCIVGVDANDTCCGYLGDKLIAGTGVTITKNIATGESGCKTLTISTSCFTWNNITFSNKWRNLDPSGIIFTLAKYSSTINCEVKLRGCVTLAGYNDTKSVIGILPIAPPVLRRYSINVLSSSTVIPTLIDIYPDGSIKLFSVTDLINKTISLSLDGIYFETV
jgi:hypothetical protein